MGIRLGDLYEDVLTIERAIIDIENDIHRSDCDSVTKCRLENELIRIKGRYQEILHSEFDFIDVDFFRVIEAINNCMECVSLDLR